jgi:hypothetical protein
LNLFGLRDRNFMLAKTRQGMETLAKVRNLKCFLDAFKAAGTRWLRAGALGIVPWVTFDPSPREAVGRVDARR